MSKQDKTTFSYEGKKPTFLAEIKNHHCFTMVTPHFQTTDWKQSVTDIMITGLDSAQTCSCPGFMLIKGSDNEKPWSKMSSSAVIKAICAVLWPDPFINEGTETF